MKTIYSDKHRLQHGRAELNDGVLQPCFENPSRAEHILTSVLDSKLGTVLEPKEFDLKSLARVHSPQYLQFLQTAWNEWSQIHGDIDALPLVWPVRGLRQIIPDYIDGKISYYAMDAGTPITSGTWQAATAAANVALTAQQIIANGESSAFALCRPPGHHASADVYGGYCFLNNAAIAAQACLDQGAKKVAILDVDYHHGNGTQSIFYNRSDVLFCSIHADPKQEFPYFLGHKDEIGSEDGIGFNQNYPLPFGTAFDTWCLALEQSLLKIKNYKADLLIISLGVDTFKNDPISEFKLESKDYLIMGKLIAKLKIPTLFVMEGGYDVAEIGVNTVNVLKGFEGD
jgi:acetoin utilization deacetylase AcuC-like enzyme